MSDVARAIEQAATCNVDENLWWDSHESLFYELDKIVSSRPKVPQNGLAEKLHANHCWLLNMVFQFKPPSASSRSALGVAKVHLGRHTVEINEEVKRLALQLSEKLMLDEVQTYLLVIKNTSAETLFGNPEIDQKIILNYYLERQCLLKCTRLLLLFHVADSSDMITAESIDDEVKELVKDGLENKVRKLLQNLLSVKQPLHLDPILYNLWAEEIVIEQTLVMDILFLLYYEPLCYCGFSQWKELFVMFQENVFSKTAVGKLLITAEGVDLARLVKHQAVLIILEALDLEEVLRMVFHEEAFRQGRHPFSIEELMQIDALFANVNPLDVEEYAPLLLGWATFGCLVSFLPADEKAGKCLEIDHGAYIQQAYEGGALKYLLARLHHQGFQNLDAQIGGYKCVIKSLISSFIAAYDIACQENSEILDNLVEILYAIYSEEEVLCVEFWDRDSVLDGPVRNLLFSFQEWFPYQLQPLVRLLAAFSEGPWPAECVYDFLYSMVDVTFPYQNHSDTSVTGEGQILNTKVTLPVPGSPGLRIPAGSTGHVIRVIDDKTCLVHWECKHSAIIILLFHLMDLSTVEDSWVEVQAILKLLYRMLSANKVLAEFFMELDNSVACTTARSDGRMESTTRIDVLNIVSMLLDKLLEAYGDVSTAALCVKILGVFAFCCPMKVMSELSRSVVWKAIPYTNNFMDQSLLAKIISIMFMDSEPLNGRHILIVGVLDLFKTLIGKGIQSEGLSKMVIHGISNVFVKHMTWNYNQKYECWKVFTKVFELSSMVLSISHPKVSYLKTSILDLMLVDSYVHDAILKILSTTCRRLEELSFNCLIGVKEIEWIEKALISGMMTLQHLLLTQDSSMTTQLEHTWVHHVPGAVAFINSVVSLTGFTQNQDLQAASIRMLRTLCIVAHRARSHSNIISSYIQGVEQKLVLKLAFGKLISKEMAFSNLEIFTSAADLLITAARCQPSLVDLLFSPMRKSDGSFVSNPEQLLKSSQSSNTQKQSTVQNNVGSSLQESVWTLLTEAQSLLESHPHILSSILLLLKSLWQEGIEFPVGLEAFRCQEGFWNILTKCVLVNVCVSQEGTMNREEMLTKSFQYQCQTSALQIMAFEAFLQQSKASHNDANSTVHGTSAKAGHSGSTAGMAMQELPFMQWIKVEHPSKIIHSFAHSFYDKAILSKAKAELRALLVGLMIKILVDDTLGLSASLMEWLQECLKAVLEHLSFQGLRSYYLSQGYGYGKELQVLIMSDLYYHLQGELEAGRNIPPGSFQQLVKFIDEINWTLFLYPNKQMHIDGFYVPFSNDFNHEAMQLGHHLGQEWWSHTDFHIHLAAESALNALQHANGLTCLVSSQLLTLESFISLLVLSSSDKQVFGAGSIQSKHEWVDSCVMELCDELESSAESFDPIGDSTHQYILKLMATQSQLLLVLVQIFPNCLADGISQHLQVQSICMKVMKAIVRCMRSILDLLSVIQPVPKDLVQNLLGALLICLQLMQDEIDHQNLHEKEEFKHLKQNNQGVAADVALTSMEFLPMLCSFVELKDYANLAIAAIGVLVKQFLAPPTWLPILRKHFPIRPALSLLWFAEGTDTAYQVLSLFLLISHVRGGAQLLQSSTFFAHIMLFSEQLKEEVSYVVGDMEGPFCAWKKKTKKKELWVLCVAIVSAAVQSLGNKDGSTAVDNALVFFESQKEVMVCALKSPCFTDADERKKARYHYPQTTISALQETQQVLHLMIELICHHEQRSNALGRSATDFRKVCIHLLAYIAREGLTRSISGVSTHMRCPPTKNEEMLAHKKPSRIGCSIGWFAVTAKGSSPANAKVFNETFPVSGLSKGRSGQSERDASAPTQYSDYVALDVYKLELLLLEFLCKQAQHAVKGSECGVPINYSIIPELPAPEILYGLQDQVMSVITDICSKRSGRSVEQETQQACWTLLSIMERALFLEVCVSRLCGIGPLSSRSEDFLKEYKLLLNAVEGHQFLVEPLKGLNVIVGLAHPTLC